MSNNEKKSTNCRSYSRKDFFKYSGTFAAAMAVTAYGCENSTGTLSENSTENSLNSVSNGKDPVNLGSGDIGVLNYAYALEQLEAAYYTQVVENPAHALTSDARNVLENLQEHEVAHREFYKAALGNDAIRDLEVDFSSVDFDDCHNVLTVARTFEDLGVSAYNGAGQLLENTDFLLAAGKIVSVEARHASAIRSVQRPRTGFFAGDDIIGENALDVVRSPSEVLSAASKYIVDEIDASNLPQPNNS